MAAARRRAARWKKGLNRRLKKPGRLHLRMVRALPAILSLPDEQFASWVACQPEGLYAHHHPTGYSIADWAAAEPGEAAAAVHAELGLAEDIELYFEQCSKRAAGVVAREFEQAGQPTGPVLVFAREGVDNEGEATLDILAHASSWQSGRCLLAALVCSWWEFPWRPRWEAHYAAREELLAAMEWGVRRLASDLAGSFELTVDAWPLMHRGVYRLTSPGERAAHLLASPELMAAARKACATGPILK